MIGLFDSGMGGFNTAGEIKRLLPRESLLLLADCERAPYGTRAEEDLISITEENIRRLSAAGAERVLIACCTASSLYERLSPEARMISIPVITPTARAARVASVTGRISVIATEGTVRSRAFSRALVGCEVTELAAGELVGLCEDGEDCPRLSRLLDGLTDEAAESSADTLILGCTHFHSVERQIKELAARKGIKNVISSAREGARELCRILKTS